METFNRNLQETVLEVRLDNAYQRSWNGLIANEIIYKYWIRNYKIKFITLSVIYYRYIGESDEIRSIFTELVTVQSVERNLNFIVYTFSEVS